MTAPVEVVVGFTSIAVLLIINMLLLAAAWGRLGQGLADLKERVSKIERPVGLEGGEAAFMRRTECPLMDGTIRRDMSDMKDRMTTLEREVRELVMQYKGDNRVD